MHLISLLFVILLSHLVCAGSQTCYFPNKVVVPGHRPCNESANQSHCCGPNDFCLDNGLCYDTAGTISQQTCTDPNWDASDCFQLCKEARSGLPIMPTGLFIDLAQGIRTFCCDIDTYNSANDTCLYGGTPTMPFGLPFGKVITDRSTGSIEIFNSTHRQDPTTANSTKSATTQTVTITASGNSNGTASTQNDASKLAAVGAGVGAPLALALLGVSYLLYREKQKTANRYPVGYISSSKEDQRAWVAQVQQQGYTQTRTQDQNQYAYTTETPESYNAPHHAHPQSIRPPTELDATRVGELDARHSRWVNG
ncbi:uncharacterized protein BDZ99DRAFT_459741 [Mytilinidion resinicola]|uniref:Mid2 domain-containing protein n=1 Tax=Mytilinidion resinicola TaxID=574789 RepID=A0A6A6YZ12_9PEZI|nr:uncharacterized protein BDZ99DRAFT_459741 [Mytilinidion resinicola]KAF2813990.1 hypothetical protein BDZ99DRAFT_459741 [Mytilinidion resinicola]